MRNPSIFTAGEMINYPNSTELNGKWIPVRPLPFYGLRLFHNLKIAWSVFTGKYDALKWEDQ